MTPPQVAAILALAAARDRRTVGEVDVRAWHEDIGDLDFDDARNAVSRHFRESTEYLMPVHVRRIATELRRQRRELEAEQERRKAIEAYAATAGPLTDRSAEIQEFVGKVRTGLPEGDREALMPRTVAWEREHRHHQRQAGAEPNPDYDASMGPVPEWCASKAPPAGAWWEDPAARERHAQTLLAEAGRLRRDHKPREAA
ncbi:hypothetical protein [Micromonospora sp. WMMD1082]|uniref:hypothetical protein n=1 Tax=Micromonospora sp. WMMD1082 TaxID=3016104 RepID=UPI0024176F36|nr:hypothetical protein [Micromonospora sp. WMMD1082]MDG4796198.1 hypothetical protein [Micromonospora sp. WMMD1082]